MYILCLWNTIQSSSISNIVSESLLWPFLAVLSLLVLLHSQHRFRRHNNRHSLSPLNLRCLPAVVLEFRTCSRCCWGVLHRTDHCTSHHCREYCSDYISAGITEIVLLQSTRRWKPRSHRRLHTPSCITQSFCVKAHAPHAPSSALVDVTRDVIRATSALPYISIQSFADVSATSSCWHHLLTFDHVDFDRWLLIVDCWLWSLTFLHGWLLQSRFFLPNFSRRFHFCSLFLHIVSLNG